MVCNINWTTLLVALLCLTPVGLALISEQFFTALCLQHAYYVPRITILVKYYTDLLNKYQDDLSQFIIDSLLSEAYTREASMNLIQNMQTTLLKILFHSQFIKMFKFLWGPALKFLSSMIAAMYYYQVGNFPPPNGGSPPVYGFDTQSSAITQSSTVTQTNTVTMWTAVTQTNAVTLWRAVTQTNTVTLWRAVTQTNAVTLWRAVTQSNAVTLWSAATKPKAETSTVQPQSHKSKCTKGYLNCNCMDLFLVFPREFHWLIFDTNRDPQENRTPNEIHQSIIELFNASNLQSRFPAIQNLLVSERQEDNLHKMSVEKEKLLKQKGIIEHSKQYTGWSSEILKEASSENEPKSLRPYEDSEDPNQTEWVDTEHMGWSPEILSATLTENGRISRSDLPPELYSNVPSRNDNDCQLLKVHPEKAYPESGRRKEEYPDNKVAREMGHVEEYHFEVSNPDDLRLRLCTEYTKDEMIHIVPNPTGLPEDLGDPAAWRRDLGRLLVIVVSEGRVRKAIVIQPEEMQDEVQPGALHLEEVGTNEVAPEEHVREVAVYPEGEHGEPAEEYQDERPFEQPPENLLRTMRDARMLSEPDINGISAGGVNAEDEMARWRRAASAFVGRSPNPQRCASAPALCGRCKRSSWKYATRDLRDLIPQRDVPCELREQLLRLEWPRSVYTLRQPR